MSVDPYPLALAPILKEKVWGGRRLESYGKTLPPGELIGESWEVADLAQTAASGGGGGEARSPIANGPLEGSTLHDAVGAWRAALLGGDGHDADFPLLVKYLDAAEHLSVQVHPTPEYAAARAGAALKSESWFVLEAAPGAVLYTGLNDGVTPAQVAAGARDGSVARLLRTVPAVAGECHHVPSGTVHALGAGVVVAEIQTPSDTTFRIYDWKNEYGRTGRELHLDAALQSMHVGPAPPPVRLGANRDVGELVTTDHFWIWQVRLRGAARRETADAQSWRVVMAIDGVVELSTPTATRSERIPLERGETAVVPAALAGGLELASPASGEALLVGVGAPPALVEASPS